MTEESLPPAEVNACKVSSSTIPGIKVDDELNISVAFDSQFKEAELGNLSGPDGITCAFVSLDTLNVKK